MSCAVKGCAFHLCREHWRRIGWDGRAELWRGLGLTPPDELAG